MPESLPLRQAYSFATENGIGTQANIIRNMRIEWNRSSTVRRGYIIRLFQEYNLLAEFIENYWTNHEARQIPHYLQFAQEYDERDIPEEENIENISEEQSLKFALEAHLRDFLAKNLNHIESGLSLYQANERTGIEFPVDGGRIDILAIDKTGTFVVIELKLSQGRNKALGQLLYYMGWVDKKLGQKPCRGIIIASDISGELEIAASRVSGIELFRYKMNFSVEKAS
jgi:hypothetical protein